MPYYVAPGKAITSPRGIIASGDADSEVTWQRLCKHKDDPKAEKSAKGQIPRLMACGAIVEADERPLSPQDVADGEARNKITETIPLQRPQGRDGRKTGVKGRQAGKLAEAQERVAKAAEVQKQSVDLSGDEAAEDAKAAEDAAAAAKGGAKRAAAKPKGD